VVKLASKEQGIADATPTTSIGDEQLRHAAARKEKGEKGR
jgi:hypothetical protein